MIKSHEAQGPHQLDMWVCAKVAPGLALPVHRPAAGIVDNLAAAARQRAHESAVFALAHVVVALATFGNKLHWLARRLDVIPSVMEQIFAFRIEAFRSAAPIEHIAHCRQSGIGHLCNLRWVALNHCGSQMHCMVARCRTAAAD